MRKERRRVADDPSHSRHHHLHPRRTVIMIIYEKSHTQNEKVSRDEIRERSKKKYNKLT